MVLKHRSYRGTLTSKIKEAIFSVFGEANLPPISMNASPAEINKWKRNPSIAKCYRMLPEPINEFEDEQVTYLLRITERVFVDPKKTSDILIAYAMSVCETFLNPENEHIQVTESIIKEAFEKNLVSFAILRKLLKFR